MQTSTIKKLFYEKVGTLNSIKLNKKCLNLLDKVIKMENRILEELDTNTKALFETYLDILSEYNGELIDFYYIEGFKIGVGIGIESKK